MFLKMLTFLTFLNFWYSIAYANPHAIRLFDDLMTGYNKLIRPVRNDSQVLTVKFKLKLSQLIDVHEKNQIMTTNVWLKQEWFDYKLTWNKSKYGGVEVMYIPANLIWQPDIVLYNNADGNYQVSIMTKAQVYHNGTVVWEPPAIYKSMCPIDVKWFPFDEQFCDMKFGSWTYDGFEIDLVHYDTDKVEYKMDEKFKWAWRVAIGIDLSDFYTSVEWDILGVPGDRHAETYASYPAPYYDITYTINLRRKTLFYTINLIVPCVGISFLATLVFYLPSDSGEKVTLCISILISLTVFFLLLVEIIPSTSLVVPLIAKYLLFTMVMVVLSIAVTVVTLNFHFRSHNTHVMSPWIRKLFLNWLPKMLLMRRPLPKAQLSQNGKSGSDANLKASQSRESRRALLLSQSDSIGAENLNFFTIGSPSDEFLPDGKPTDRQRLITAATVGANFIAEQLRKQEAVGGIKEDWRFVALVLDRLFLWIFVTISVSGSCGIILAAPVIKDYREPII